jgi:hypothetical protein
MIKKNMSQNQVQLNKKKYPSKHELRQPRLPHQTCKLSHGFHKVK